MTDTSIPPGVQTMLGAAGAPARVHFGGRVWLIGHPVQSAKAELEELAAAAAISEVRALKGAVPADAYAELWRDTLGAVQGKEFRTWGPGWRRVVLARENGHLFLLALLRAHHPDATEADALALAAGAPEEVAAALARVVPDFLRGLLSGLTLPPDRLADLEAKLATLIAPPNPDPDPPPPPSPPTP